MIQLMFSLMASAHEYHQEYIHVYYDVLLMS